MSTAGSSPSGAGASSSGAPGGAEEGIDQRAVRTTRQLAGFLEAVTTDTARSPLRDIAANDRNAPDVVVWLGDLPDSVRAPVSDGTVLELDPPPAAKQPRLPDALSGRLDEHGENCEGPEPELAPTPEDEEHPRDVLRAFDSYLEQWRRWAERERRARVVRELYEDLERIAKTVESQEDEYECVLATGLVTWDPDDGDRRRRHLLTEPVQPAVDRRTARIAVRRSEGGRRMEERPLFDGRREFVPDRARPAKVALLESDADLLDHEVVDDLHEWLSLAVQVPVETADDWDAPEPGPDLVLTPSPALLLRPRSRDKEAEAYREIGEALRESDAPVPVALAQQSTQGITPADRVRWLSEQGIAGGDAVGADPLFPLPANDAQGRVLDLLRRETSVVVQGPPGTGKTHTIANLISALLARGQRVLVTSQKEQALRVLRDKVPEELRQLCVLLAGGSRDASEELQRSLEALSEAMAGADLGRLRADIEALTAERDELRRRSSVLNKEIRALRSTEQEVHPPVVPGFSEERYRGTLSEIVAQVRRGADQHGWMPAVPAGQPDVPPLSARDFHQLRQLSVQDTAERRARAVQWIPAEGDLPEPGELAELVADEQRARRDVAGDADPLAEELAGAGSGALDELSAAAEQARGALRRCQLDGGSSATAPEWVGRALRDRLAGRNVGVWDQLCALGGAARQLQDRLARDGVSHHVELPPLTTGSLGRARGWLAVGEALRKHFESGGKLRKVLPKQAQKDAQPLLDAVHVDGSPPDTAEKLSAALNRIEAEVAVVQLAEKWADADVEVSVGERVNRTLSELGDDEAWLQRISEVVAARDRAADVLAGNGLQVDLSTRERIEGLVGAVPVAQRHARAERARQRVEDLHRSLAAKAGSDRVCPEVTSLLGAVRERDQERYAEVLSGLDNARQEQAEEVQRAKLARTLGAVHPRLLEVVQSAEEQPWEQGSPAVAEAWAWSKAEQFVSGNRSADHERELAVEFDRVEERIKQVTAQLAGKTALVECHDRMSDEHVQALRTYQEHMRKVGAGTGRMARKFLRAAKAAMRKAKTAVPAWVVPLPNLLDTISAERNSFDVVIVDEASQVGLEHLYLLWMAPRIIVVGDEKQCTPSETRLGKQKELFERLQEYLPDVDPDLRYTFTGKTNLYGLLSARSGKDSVIRLREHFRCMPEIIGWSSGQFYDDRLVPLRQPEADRLEPLRVTEVPDAYREGTPAKWRNPVEVKEIVETLCHCLGEPDYADKTFGVIALQNSEQLKALDTAVSEAVAPEERQKRRIRVGSPANFQGDERDVVLLSMAVTERPVAVHSLPYQQAFNVAASRAKDQLWLFTSVAESELPKDLRRSLLTYMRSGPSPYGESPSVDDVPEDTPRTPFDSLFEQKVFREIRGRGFHVVPQYELGSRRIDMVVVGRSARLAVECDGRRFHAGLEQERSDARRDRELAQMNWQTLRVRESEFEFDRDRELRRVWQRLGELGVEPVADDVPAGATAEWEPTELDDEEDDDVEGALL